MLYGASHGSAPTILELLRRSGVQISDGPRANLLLQDQAVLHAEQAAIVAAGLASSPWQHLDATATRVNGRNHACAVLCNPLDPASTTTPTQDRQTVLAVLRNGRPAPYLLNDAALGYLAPVPLAAKTRQRLTHRPRATGLDAPTLRRRRDAQLPRLGEQPRQGSRDALAVAASPAQPDGPVVRLLVCDDAPQVTWLTAARALCWGHDGRPSQQRAPFLPPHRQALADVRKDFWAASDELVAYRPPPTPAERPHLEAAFDTLFARQTGYWRLDERIASTRGPQAHRRLVLAHPESPLPTTPAEVGARARVRKRNVSFGPRTAEGARAWDTGMTRVATAKQLGVGIYRYLHDRVAGARPVPALADLIDERARELNLGASWAAS